MEITTNTSITITLNGQNYSFDNPHPITDLIDQLNIMSQDILLWKQKVDESQSRIDDLQSKIKALCVTPV